MPYITDENSEKSKRHEELTKLLTEAKIVQMTIYENYYAGKATAEELIQAQENVNQIQEEWRNTIVTLKIK